MADQPNPALAGYEAVVAFKWGVNRIADGVVTVSLSHPRVGGISYLLTAGDAKAIATALQEALAPKDATPPASASQMTH